MENSIIRFQEIKIENFKNIENGSISFPNFKKSDFSCDTSDIIGIYGQNGSGKTALVEAIKILKYILSGIALPTHTSDLILSSSKYSKLSFTFYVKKNDYEKYLVNYNFTIEKVLDETEENNFAVSEERFSYKKYVDGKWTKTKDIIYSDSENEKDVFLPKKNLNQFEKKEVTDLDFAKKYAFKTKRSFIFSKEAKEIFNKNDSFTESYDLIKLLDFFARINLHIIDNSRSGLINANIILPFSFRYKEEKILSHGDFALPLSEPSIIPANIFELVKKILKQMNIVLEKLIPGLEIKIKEYGAQLTKTNQEGIRFELISKRDNVEIALKYESEGIKKIISILSTLIAVYKNPSFCLVVDEFDASIFEYLLGEILDILSKYGKGQLIFTSHNLRPLEILKPDCIIFTTVNPKNKYIRYSNVKNNNNLRSVYMRSLILGGQSEVVYQETSSSDIRRSFKEAGRISDAQN